MKNLDAVTNPDDVPTKQYVDDKISIGTSQPAGSDWELWVDTDEPDLQAIAAGLVRPTPYTDTWFAPGFINAVALGTVAGAANRLEAWFFQGLHVDVAVKNVALEVTALVAGAKLKVAVYSCLGTGWPDAKLAESAEFDGGTASIQTLAFSHTFAASTPYWISVFHSSTATTRTVTTNALWNNLPATAPGTAAVTELRTTSRTYSSGFPSSWGSVAGQLTATAPIPHVQFQVV